MGNIYTVSLRLAVALVCVGVSLIMGGQWLGLIPNADRIHLESRASRCEAISIQSALLIRDGRWDELNAVLSAIAQRNADLESIGVRGMDGKLIVDTGGHTANWTRQSNVDGVDAIHVPMAWV